MRGRSPWNHGSTPQDWNEGKEWKDKWMAPYVLRIRGANKLQNTRGKAWEPPAYVIVSTLRR